MDYQVILHRIGQSPSAALLIFGLFGYLLGSLPFAIWITRAIKGVDVRDAGSGHATTTNTIRQAGFAAGLVVLVFDIAKGFVPVYLGYIAGAPGWVLGLVSAAAVAGHCWPVYANFRGGMGLATAGGGYLAVFPLGFAVALGLLLLLTLVIRHSARASVFTGVLAGPLLMLFSMPASVVWVALMSGLVVAGRFTTDWRREYKELWLDRG